MSCTELYLHVTSLLIISISCQNLPDVNNNFESNFPSPNIYYQETQNVYQNIQQAGNGYGNGQEEYYWPEQNYTDVNGVIFQDGIVTRLRE